MIDLALYTDVLQERGEQRICCPFCPEEDTGYHLYANPSKGVFHCFRCEAKGSIKSLLKKLEIEPIQQIKKPAYDKFRELFKQQDAEHIKIQDFHPLLGSTDIFGKLCLSYLEKRGIPLEDIHYHRLHYTDAGKYKYRVVLPCFENGEFVYFTARTIIEGDPNTKRYLNPPKKYTKLSRAQVIFNIDSIHENEPCIIMEGILNAIVCGRKAVALLGKYANQEQYHKLLNKNCSEYVIALDKDASIEAYKLASTLHSAGKTVRITEFPDNQDAVELGRKKTLELIEKSAQYDMKAHLKSKITLS